MLKWQWFLGGKTMFWMSIIVLIVLILTFTVSYIIDPVGSVYTERQKTNADSIKKISEEYVKKLRYNN